MIVLPYFPQYTDEVRIHEYPNAVHIMNMQIWFTFMNMQLWLIIFHKCVQHTFNDMQLQLSHFKRICLTFMCLTLHAQASALAHTHTSRLLRDPLTPFEHKRNGDWHLCLVTTSSHQ